MAAVSARGVDGEGSTSRREQGGEFIAHHCGEHRLVRPRAVQRRGFDLQLGGSGCGKTAARIDEEPGARRAGHGVEEVGALDLVGRLVEDEAVQGLARVGHLLHSG